MCQEQSFVVKDVFAYNLLLCAGDRRKIVHSLRLHDTTEATDELCNDMHAYLYTTWYILLFKYAVVRLSSCTTFTIRHTGCCTLIQRVVHVWCVSIFAGAVSNWCQYHINQTKLVGTVHSLYARCGHFQSYVYTQTVGPFGSFPDMSVKYILGGQSHTLKQNAIRPSYCTRTVIATSSPCIAKIKFLRCPSFVCSNEVHHRYDHVWLLVST